MAANAVSHAVRDLRAIVRFCVRERLEVVPPSAVRYLAANAEFFTSQLHRLYVETSADARAALVRRHKELDPSVALTGFDRIARAAVWKATSIADRSSAGLMEVREDDVHMLLRVMEGVSVLPPREEPALTLSPITLIDDVYELPEVDPGEDTLDRARAAAVPIVERIGHHREFLAALWRIVFGEWPVPIVFLNTSLPRGTYEALYKARQGRNVPIPVVLDFCEQSGVLKESAVASVATIIDTWSKLKPESKVACVELFAEHGITDLPTAVFRLDAGDRSVLKVRWEAADSLVAMKKSQTLEELRPMGIELGERRLSPSDMRVDDRFDALTDKLGALLRAQVEIDAAAIAAEFPSQPPEAVRARQRSRLAGEFWDAVGIIRAIERTLAQDFPGIRHLADAAFEKLQALEQSLGKAALSLKPSPDTVVAFKRLTEKPTMNTNISITGNGNVVGNNNRVITVINQALADQSKELAEAFGLLKAEVLEIKSLTEADKRRAVRAIEDAEQEAAEQPPAAPQIEGALERAQQALERAGKVYDAAEPWAQRLATVGGLLMKFVPGAWPWLSGVLK